MNQKSLLIASVATLPLLLSGCEFAPKLTAQNGYRGTGQQQVINPRVVAYQVPIPANVYPTPDDSGPRAGATYQNVQVLKNVSTERFNHFMAQINNWVAPQSGDPAQQGCNYCHNPNNMASDEKYTKVVARRMIQMTQNINVNWTPHVQQTGVTCWTCHRGNAVPAYKWAMAAPDEAHGMLQGRRGQNMPNAAAGFASLPYDPFSPYLTKAGVNNIRVQNRAEYPSANHIVSEKTTEQTYGLMMHLSQGLGVNCTYCHNSRAFADWSQSHPARVTAWYGLRMVAQANSEYMGPLAAVFPALHAGAADPYRKGPMGDVYKVNCATCHQGLNKPMNGVSMRPENPVLWPAALPAVATHAAAPAAAAMLPASTTAPVAPTKAQSTR